MRWVSRSGAEISIKDLVEEVAAAVGFVGRVVWDASKPNGQPRRKLDTRRAEERFGFHSTTGFDKGLERTVDWYRRAMDATSIQSSPR